MNASDTLLATVRSGDGLAFGRLVEPHRRPDEIAHFPSRPTDPSTVGAVFERFGLPGRLD